MNDKEFLIWLRERLIHQHGENELVDYMHKFTAIINYYDPEKITDNFCKSLGEG